MASAYQTQPKKAEADVPQATRLPKRKASINHETRLPHGSLAITQLLLVGSSTTSRLRLRTAGLTCTGTVRIRMHNKLAALVALGKYLGMFDERPQNTNVIYAISNEPMSAEEWKKQYVTDR